MTKRRIPDELLLRAEKPGRYTGGELNAVIKDKAGKTRFAFCFPDVYEVGMSYLGLQILYYFLNDREDTWCERVFAPWTDMEKIMRDAGIPLFALESQEEIKNFDFVGFTLQYEMSYTNVLNMLDLAGIPILAADRGESDPIVVFGGPCTYNPEPMAAAADFFYIGEGEALYGEILEVYKKNKAAGGTREDFLEKLLDFDGVYVPKFYDVTYRPDGTVAKITPNHPRAKAVIKKVIVNDFETSFFPEKFLVPLIEVIHDRASLELFRGCIRGCRFCQAGFVTRPVRERSAERLLEQAKKIVESTGHEEISLVSLSTSDYRGFKCLTDLLLEEFTKKYVNLSLPSLRIDAFALDIMQRIQSVRKSGLTFAPEAGSQRLRNVINKNLTEEEIMSGCRLAYEAGWTRVKLYFMMGLPTETDEDLKAIGRLTDKIVEEYYRLPPENRKGNVAVTASASCFVPKPFTPFQWEAQNTWEEFRDKGAYVKKHIGKRQARFSYHDGKLSVLEGVLARGDRRVFGAVKRAWELGATFDGWSEKFDFEKWTRAFEETGVDPLFYTARERSFEEVLPWDHLSAGVSKSFLWAERERSRECAVTPNCREKCSACGAAAFKGGVCLEVRD